MEAFTGEVRLMGFAYAPVGWAVCDGTPLSVAAYGPLFQQIGYRFGGSGGTFNLPDLRDGQIAIGVGAGPGLTPRKAGERGGAAEVQLSTNEVPAHLHSLMTVADPGDVSTPKAETPLARSNGKAAYRASATNLKSLDARVVSTAPGGDGVGHENRMPYQAVCYCICLQGQRTEE